MAVVAVAAELNSCRQQKFRQVDCGVDFHFLISLKKIVNG